MKRYLTLLITEKGISLDDTIKGLEAGGNFGVTWQMLVDFIVAMPSHHTQIRKTLVKIDFLNGDVFHYLNHLSVGMMESIQAAEDFND